MAADINDLERFDECKKGFGFETDEKKQKLACIEHMGASWGAACCASTRNCLIALS